MSGFRRYISTSSLLVLRRISLISMSPILLSVSTLTTAQEVVRDQDRNQQRRIDRSSRIDNSASDSATATPGSAQLRDWDPSNFDIIVVADKFFQEKNRAQLETIDCYAKNWG